MFRAGWTAKVSFFSQLMVVSIVDSRIYNDVTYVVNCRRVFVCEREKSKLWYTRLLTF